MARGKVLSHQIEAIEYVHAKDGQPYRHDFTSGDSDIRLRPDGSVVISNKRKKLWDVFTVAGEPQDFLVNPRGVRDSTRRRKAMATRKRKSAKKRRRNAPMSAAQRKYFGPKRKRRRNPVAALSTTPTRRKRSVRANPPKRRRRHRRNPPAFSVNGLLGNLTTGLMDAGAVVGGKTLVRLASSQFSYADGSMMDSAIELGAALVVSMIAPRFMDNTRARMMAAGGFSSVLETLIAQANIPTVSGLLGATSGVDTRVVYTAADSPYLLRSGSMSGYAKGAPGTPRPLLTAGAPTLGFYAKTSPASSMS